MLQRSDEAEAFPLHRLLSSESVKYTVTRIYRNVPPALTKRKERSSLAVKNNEVVETSLVTKESLGLVSRGPLPSIPNPVHRLNHLRCLLRGRNPQLWDEPGHRRLLLGAGPGP